MEECEDREYTEGEEAAKAGKDFSACPYTFANAGVPLPDYEWGDYRSKRNKWFHGWTDQRREMGNLN